jgi:hypothetical protein
MGSLEPLDDALADGYMSLGRLDEAIAEYERGLQPVSGNSTGALPSCRGIPPQGNPIAAKAQFSEFLELWKHADPDLPEIAEARRWAQQQAASGVLQ